MGFILLVKNVNGKYYVLLHRRAAGMRDPFKWGIPGGRIDKYELDTIEENNGNNDLLESIYRRQAFREFIEECGGGSGTNMIGSSFVLGGIEGTNIRATPYNSAVNCNVLIPDGIKNMTSDPSLTKEICSIGHTARKTKIYLYVMKPDVDEQFVNGDWKPRAMPYYR